MKDNIRAILSNRTRRHIPEPAGLTPAAVLMPIYEYEGEYFMVFTKRTDKVQNHKGQISFPGGRYEEADGNLLQTALREAHEEIGLLPGDVDILGELDEEMTVATNFLISPYVAAIPYPYPFEISPDEVQELLKIPISTLLDKRNFHKELTTEGGVIHEGYFYHVGGDVIWGATARILKRFFDLIYG